VEVILRFPVSMDNGDLSRVKDALTIDDEGVASSLTRIAMAATHEYLDMMARTGIPSRIDDLKAERLRYLIEYYYVDRLPNEGEVSAVYQIPASRCRSVMRNAMALFRPATERAKLRSLREVLMEAKKEGGRAVVQSDHLLSEMRTIVERSGPKLEPIRKVKNMSRTYHIPSDTLQALQAEVETRIQLNEAMTEAAPTAEVQDEHSS